MEGRIEQEEEKDEKERRRNKSTKYKTMSCDRKYMFTGSLQPTDAQDNSNMSLELLCKILCRV